MAFAAELVSLGLVGGKDRLDVIVGFLESLEFTCVDDLEGKCGQLWHWRWAV